ncbi:unnamed protein product [Dibothriocephalus latus]|uniref:FZ domain-containing protein n=1 Tax=Dibothriocephalus latus TaxID=60516 RepID=A0A3P7NQM5_DIBLA|nr:unnamed protein product [Dibothriocephalus latus]
MFPRVHRTVRQTGLIKASNAESAHLSDPVPNGLADSVTYRHQEEVKSAFGPHSGASIFSLGDLNDAVHDEARRPEKCVPIEIPMCKSIGYNLTYMPNEFNHETQEEAGLEVSNAPIGFLLSLALPYCLSDHVGSLDV